MPANGPLFASFISTSGLQGRTAHSLRREAAAQPAKLPARRRRASRVIAALRPASVLAAAGLYACKRLLRDSPPPRPPPGRPRHLDDHAPITEHRLMDRIAGTWPPPPIEGADAWEHGRVMKLRVEEELAVPPTPARPRGPSP